MTIAIGFAPLLQLLAAQTAGDAKALGEKKLDFDTKVSPNLSELRGFDPAGVVVPVERICCALGSASSFSRDVFELRNEPHTYKTDRFGGGTTGYVYTRRGGFVDLGHLRDHIDYTRFFAVKFKGTGSIGSSERIFSEGGKVHLVIKPRSEWPNPSITTVSPVLAALVGARLSYERAVWHEICSCFPEAFAKSNVYSAFAPDDNFSNALGALAGYRTMLTPNMPYGDAADQALLGLLADLGPATKEQTSAAVDYVKDHWWDSGTPGPDAFPNAMRRNFNSFNPVAPWRVTDIVVPGKAAKGEELRAALAPIRRNAYIEIPQQHEGQLLHKLAYLEVRDVLAPIMAVVPRLAEQGHIKSFSDFRPLVDALRAKEREKGSHADSPS